PRGIKFAFRGFAVSCFNRNLRIEVGVASSGVRPNRKIVFDVHLNVALGLVIELPVLALPNLRINSRNRFIEVPHSHLSASIGWTRAARRAGIKHARAATAKSTREATTTVGIKCGWKP